MNDAVLHQQNMLLQNRERISAEIKKYPNIVHVGVGSKEIKHQLTDIPCYRIYVNQKKPLDTLLEHERIPASIDGFITDVLEYGEVENTAGPKVRDDDSYRPLKGGIQIKNDLYTDIAERGGGTLGCLVLMDDGSGTIVGLTNHHVAAYNTEDSHPEISNKIGQPWRHICCCCCEKNIIGNVLDAKKDDTIDCAIIEFTDDIVKGIKNGGTINEIAEIGNIRGTVIAFPGMSVRKRGARTRVTKGTVVDVAFENGQVLIAPAGDDDPVFCDFGDSGSIVVDDQNQVIGLLWGIKRNRLIAPGQPVILVSDSVPLDPRTHGVVTPIAAVEAAMHIKIPVTPDLIPTITVHPSDTKTHIIPSSLPAAQHPKKHFVTVRGDGDIVLNVTFDQVVDPHRISWASDNDGMSTIFPGPSGDNSTVTITRKTPIGEKALITLMVDHTPVEKAFVWVVWSVPIPQPQPPHETRVQPEGTTVTKSFNRRYLIQPEAITNEDMDNNDLPDLRGKNKNPPPNVPDTDTGVYFKGQDLSGGAITKWDGSARLRCKGNTTFAAGGLDDVLPNYPSLDIVGNADISASTIDGTPYSNEGLGNVGRIYSDTTINYTVKKNVGVFGHHIRTKIQIQQFARLELDGHWYVISNPSPSRIDVMLSRKSEELDHQDYDGDGLQLGGAWLQDSIVIDDTNNDF